MLLFGRSGPVLPSAGQSPGSQSQVLRIEYQDNAPIAELGRAGDARHLNQRIADRPHHNLPLSQNSIYRDPNRVPTRAYDENMKIASGFLIELENPRQSQKGQDTAPVTDQLVV